MIDKKLDLTNSIKEYVPVILEYFVDFYGEDYREIITRRLENCTYIGYTPEDVIKGYLREIYESKTNDLVDSFLLENEIENTEDNKEKYFGGYVDFFDKKNINLYRIFSCMEVDDYTNNNNLTYYLSKFTGNDNLEFGTEEFYMIVDELKRIKPSFDRMLEEFDSFTQQYAKYQCYVDSCEELKNKLSDKYKLLYLKEIYEYLDEHDRRLVYDALNDKNDFNFWDLNCYGVWCSGLLSLPTLIDSFSSESEEKLSDENVRDYVKDSIYQDRIKYFNNLGIKLGNDYKDYINNDVCLSKIPDKFLIDEVINKRENLAEQEKREYITSTTEYQSQLKEIEKLGLIDKNISYSYSGLSNLIACINPNIIKKDGEFRLYNLLLFSGRNLSDYFDKTLLHELNHLIETELINADNEYYIVRSGWDILNCKINNETENDEKREFEYLNEIINELLCQEVTKIMHDDGVYLFDDKDTSRIKGGTSYERCRVLVRDFFDEFKDVIKYSRITGDMDSLYNVIGQDNLVALNKLIRDFFDYFSEFKFYTLCDEINKKLDTDNVSFFERCVERRDIILSKMKDKKVDYEINNSFAR